MYKKCMKSIAVGTLMTTAFISTAGAAETGNPFAVQGIDGDAMQLAQMTGASKGGKINVLNGKCGEGKCGGKRVRQMMDSDKNGQISKQEYVGWVTTMAGEEYDQMDANDSGTLDMLELITSFGDV